MGTYSEAAAVIVTQVCGDGKRILTTFEDPNCGYCKKLAKDMIKLNNVLTSEHPYKKAMPLAEALSIIEGDSNRHFDPEVVAAFLSIGPHLYNQIAQASETNLRQRMSEVLSRYFKTEAAR